MFRFLLGAALLVTLCAVASQAEQLKGKIKNVAPDKNTVTVTVGKTDQQFTISADAKILSAGGKDMAQRLQAKLFQPGVQVLVTTDKQDGKDIVKELKLLDIAPPNGYQNAADAGPDFAIQGEYEGTSAGKKVGAQVIAGGEGQFSVFFLEAGLPGAGWDNKTLSKAAAKSDGAKTTVIGSNWNGSIVDGKLTVKMGEGPGKDLTLTRVIRESSAAGAKPPPGAIVLFDGSNVSEWTNGKIVDGKYLLAGGTTKRKFGDFKLHAEFRLPFRDRDQGNSGVYMQERYEIQILNSFGRLPPRKGDCGSIYEETAPSVNMTYPPLSWQTYDIDFKAARWDAAGKKTANARVTVLHNGVKVHDDAEIKNKTGAGKEEKPDPAPIYLQMHGSPVHYRNVWVVVPSAE
jgi:hypothetical protein